VFHKALIALGDGVPCRLWGFFLGGNLGGAILSAAKGGPTSCPWCTAVQICLGRDAWGMRAREEGILGSGRGGGLRLRGK